MTRQDPALQPHDRHDRLLIAALVAGDLDAGPADVARDLVERCEACAALAADLAAIPSALRELPAPRRPRDFRISEAQAASVGRRGLARFLPAAGAWAGFARPLGSALATLGLVGLLFTSLLGSSATGSGALVPAFGPSGGSGYAEGRPGGAGDTSSGTGSKGQVAAPSPVASAAASAAAVASAAASDGRASAPGGFHTMSSAPQTPSAAPPSTAPNAASAAPSPGSAAGPSPSAASDHAKPPAPSTSGGSGVPLLPAASLAAFVAGIGLLGLDLARRRG